MGTTARRFDRKEYVLSSVYFNEPIMSRGSYERLVIMRIGKRVGLRGGGGRRRKTATATTSLNFLTSRAWNKANVRVLLNKTRLAGKEVAGRGSKKRQHWRW